VIGHALFASALAGGARARGAVIATAALCAAAPDLDVLAFFVGIPYQAPLGHRGFTHSLAFALLLGAAAALLLRTLLGRGARPPFAHTLALLTLATASHGFFDAFTNGGHGVAFLWPFDDTRYFAPFRPIQVSPLSVKHFIRASTTIVATEALWMGVPALAVWAAGRVCARAR
jgi:inner membrane protein